MYKIGITGGIGVGKSTVSELVGGMTFGKRHLVVDLDKITHEAYNDILIQEEIISLLGDEVRSYTYGIDRKKVSELAFKDKLLLNEVGNIVGRYIDKEVSDILDRCPFDDNEIVFIDGALLYEKGCIEKYGLDEVWVIYADENTRIKRIVERDREKGLIYEKLKSTHTDAEIVEIISNKHKDERARAINKIKMQDSNDSKVIKAGRVIDNSGSLEELTRIVNFCLDSVERKLNTVIKTKAVVTGSFDPLTLGHMEIIQEAAKVFDSVTVLIAHNSAKKCQYDLVGRKIMIENSLAECWLPNVNVDIHDGLVVNYMDEHGIQFIVRGLRTSEDFIYEKRINAVNKDLNGSVTTWFVITDSKLEHVSSSTVRELLKFNEDVSKYVTKSVDQYIKIVSCSDIK